jgi:hypothetical protein
MLNVDEFLEARHMLSANELQSTTLLARRRALAPPTRDAFAIFEDPCLLGNGERPQFVELESLHKTLVPT